MRKRRQEERERKGVKGRRKGGKGIRIKKKVKENKAINKTKKKKAR